MCVAHVKRSLAADKMAMLLCNIYLHGRAGREMRASAFRVSDPSIISRPRIVDILCGQSQWILWSVGVPWSSH